MDNLTHSMAGMAVAEAAWQWGRKRYSHPAVRGLLYLASILANNFPDADLAYHAITPGRLGYLLHHRGHTHTLALAIPLGILVYGLILLVARARKQKLERWDRIGIMALCVLGGVIHIGMDAMNSYGVHPFWPFSNRWFYGDGVFILEPIFWLVIAGALFFAGRTLLEKIFHGMIFALALGLVFLSGFLPLTLSIAIGVASLTWVLVQWSLSDRGRAAAAILGFIAVAFGFLNVSRQVRATVSQVIAPMMHIDDIILSPQPANPFCWNFLGLGVSTQNYVVEMGRATWGDWINPDECSSFRTVTVAPPLTASLIPNDNPNVVGLSRFEAPLSQLKELEQRDCVARAFLRFARAPYWTDVNGGTMLGDLRFMRSGSSGFGEMLLPGPERCPKFVPPWEPPRADL